MKRLASLSSFLFHILQPFIRANDMNIWCDGTFAAASAAATTATAATFFGTFFTLIHSAIRPNVMI